MRRECIVGRLAMMNNFRTLKSAAVPASSIMASTWSDAVEATAPLRVRDRYSHGDESRCSRFS